MSRTRLAVQRADELAPASFDEDGAGTPSSSAAAPAAAAAPPADGAPGPAGPAAGAVPAPPGADLLGDLLDLDTPAPAPSHAPAPAYPANGMQWRCAHLCMACQRDCYF